VCPFSYRPQQVQVYITLVGLQSGQSHSHDPFATSLQIAMCRITASVKCMLSRMAKYHTASEK